MATKADYITEEIVPSHGSAYCRHCNKFIKKCRCLYCYPQKVWGTCKMCRKKDFERLEIFVKQYCNEKGISL